MSGRARAGTTRPGCCRTTGPGPTTGCGTTCAGSPTPTRSTWSSWAAGRAARCCSSGWPGPAGGSRPWTPARSGTRTPTGSATRRGSHQLYWTEPRVIGGTDPVPMGSNNSGRGVGGSMVHYAGYTPRFHPTDFATRTPRRRRRRLAAVATRSCARTTSRSSRNCRSPGSDWPWGDPHRYPHRPHPVGGNGEIFLRGARTLGIEARVGPVAITNGRFGNRPHCIYRGFCLQGCKVNAKATPLITHIPDALAHGAEVRADAMVTRIAIDREHRAGARRALRPRRPRTVPAGGDGGGRRLLDRDAAAAAQLGLLPVPGRRCATTTTRSAGT